MVSRKTKTPTITDMRIQQSWQIQTDESNHENYVCTGWEIQVQRGTDEWVKIDVDNIIINEPNEFSAIQ